MAIPHRHSVGMALPLMIERNGPIYLGPAPDAIAAIQESLDSGRNGVVKDGGLASHRISLFCGPTTPEVASCPSDILYVSPVGGWWKVQKVDGAVHP